MTLFFSSCNRQFERVSVAEKEDVLSFNCFDELGYTCLLSFLHADAHQRVFNSSYFDLSPEAFSEIHQHAALNLEQICGGDDLVLVKKTHGLLNDLLFFAQITVDIHATSVQFDGFSHSRFQVDALDVTIATLGGGDEVCEYGLDVLGHLLVSHVFLTDHDVTEHLIPAPKNDSAALALDNGVNGSLSGTGVGIFPRGPRMGPATRPTVGPSRAPH